MRLISRYTLILAFLSIFASAPVVAQTNPTDAKLANPKVNLQRFRPAANPADYLTVYSTSLAEPWKVSGGFYLNYADDPLLLVQGISPDRQGVVDYQFFGDVFASFSIYQWAEIAVNLPVGLSTDSQTGGEPFENNISGTGIGDLRISAKGRILQMHDYGPVGLAVIGVLNAPTGDGSLMIGDEGVGFDGIMAIEYNPWGKIRLGVNLGYRFRPETVEVQRNTVGDSVIVSGGLTFPFFHDRLDFITEINGEITVDPSNENLSDEERPVEAELGFKYRIWDEEGWAKGLSATAAIGFGTLAVGSPTVRGILGLSYHWVEGGDWSERYRFGGYLAEIDECPDPETTPPEEIPEICRTVEPPDSDGDGVPDAKDRCPFKGTLGDVDENGCSTSDRDGDGILDGDDQCPDVAEDKDGFKDFDGCPDPDNDQDGIADVSDACPLEPEVINNVDDTDGCPDDDPNARISIKKGKMNIREQVFFETAKAKIKKRSHSLLDEVAELLIKNPHIGRVQIEGHTDDRGKDSYNKELSQSRAEAVRDYLIGRGVDGARLEAIGYGEERPIADNATKDGRAQNRRVEFTILGLDKE